MGFSKKGFVILAVGIVILVMSFLPWDMFLPPWNVVQGSSWIIPPGVVGTVQVDLFWGATVHGKIWCYGGNNDIDFFIADSRNHVLFNPGRIWNGYEFRWRAWSNDIYQFKFDNTISLFTSKDVGYLKYSYYYFHALLLVGTVITAIGLFLNLKAVSALLKPSEENTAPKESKKPYVEYKEGSKFSQSYIKISWTATSIFLPVCFGLVAVSYSEPLLGLPSISLLPIAMASISLFIVWWLYTNRYAGYNRSIWGRLRDLEEQAGMYLHVKIDEEDRLRSVKWRIRHVNSLMLVLLLIAWFVRIAIAPIVQ